MSTNCSCGCGGDTSGSVSGNISSTATIRGRIYSPTFVSAYSIAVQNGFKGTEKEWLESLKGEDGKSAYEIAVESGFEGTEEEWLASLIGPEGPQGEQGEQGPEGPQGEQGLEGKSAYEVAVESGFEGTQEEWLASLIGPDGKSAYEVAVEHGFDGTEDEWIQEVAGNQILIDAINQQLNAMNETLVKYGSKLDPIFEAEAESEAAGELKNYRIVVEQKQEEDEDLVEYQKLSALEINQICVL